MKFNNRDNEKIQSTDGRTFWISRSVAVIVHFVVQTKTGLKVMTVRRGPKSHNYHDHWCLPCGFLDWDESAEEACMREFYEETGIDLNEAVKDSTLVYGLDNGPWKIVTNPKADEMQNVCLHYGIFIKNDDFIYFPFSNDETAEIKLEEINEFINKKVAFGHENSIVEFLDFLFIG